ncbi:CvpA family protein [Candidatus Parcubacteria bacterium]|nr:MAG: CvpA family protein [Candidatus Parcubacteria bacterium]
MYFTILDLVLLLILFCFISFSFWLGLIQTLGGIIGLFLGIWVSGMYYDPFAAWLAPYLMDHQNIAKVIAFVLIFTLVNRLVGFIFYILNKMFNIISILPFLKSINRLAGAILGFAEGVLIIGAVILIINRYPISSYIKQIVDQSKVASWILFVADMVLSPLLPKIMFQIDYLTRLF